MNLTNLTKEQQSCIVEYLSTFFDFDMCDFNQKTVECYVLRSKPSYDDGGSIDSQDFIKEHVVGVDLSKQLLDEAISFRMWLDTK